MKDSDLGSRGEGGGRVLSSFVWWRSVSSLVNQKYQQNMSDPVQLFTLFHVFSYF